MILTKKGDRTTMHSPPRINLYTCLVQTVCRSIIVSVHNAPLYQRFISVLLKCYQHACKCIRRFCVACNSLCCCWHDYCCSHVIYRSFSLLWCILVFYLISFYRMLNYIPFHRYFLTHNIMFSLKKINN